MIKDKNKPKERRDHYIYVTKTDLNHLISKDWIEIVRSSLFPGDEVEFKRDEEKIEGTISKTFDHIFMLKDGRTFTWLDYIIGNPRVLGQMRLFHPIKYVGRDDSHNLYSKKPLK